MHGKCISIHSITVFLRNYHKHARCFLWLPCNLDIVFSGILVISGIAKLSYLVFNDRYMYNTVVESVIVLSDSTATFVSITAWVLAGGCKKWHHGLVVNRPVMDQAVCARWCSLRFLMGTKVSQIGFVTSRALLLLTDGVKGIHSVDKS